MSFATELYNRFRRFSIIDKLITITVAIFVLQIVFRGFVPTFFSHLELSGDLQKLIYKPWSIITYGFLHNATNPIHILINMLILHFIGGYVLNLFDENKVLSLFLFGVLAGGISFLIGSQIHPALLNGVAVLVGASAGIRAIIFFLVAYSPNMEVRIISFNVALKYIGAVLLVVDLYLLQGGNNVGGGFAHLGGAILGIVFAWQLRKGVNLGRSLAVLTNSSTSKKKKKPRHLKTVHNSKRVTNRMEHKTVYQKNREKQEQIDGILDKISKSGYESLSKEEKEFLFQAGKE